MRSFRFCLAVAVFLVLSVSSPANPIPACAGGTIVPNSLIGTSCIVGSLVFTFTQSSDQLPNPDGLFATEAVTFIPTILNLPSPSGTFTEAIGFQVGPLNMTAEQQGDIGYTVSLLAGSPGSITGVFEETVGQVSSPSGPFPNVGGFFELCPGQSKNFGCVFDVNQVMTSLPGSQSLFLRLPFPNSYVHSGNGSHLGVECNEAACKLDSANVLVVVTPESSVFCLSVLGIGMLISIKWAKRLVVG
jgi:hypothetical protein